jgi:multidrug efflux pump subunit AcrB
MALTVIGGLTASTLGSLIAVPCLYVALDRLRFRPKAQASA